MMSRLVAAFSAAMMLSGCVEGIVTSASFVDSQSGIYLEYRLKAAHAFLAEFHRTLHIVFAHKQVDFPLEMDTGGYLLLNIYRLADRRLLLFDGEDYVVIDSEREVAELVGAPPETRPAQYLGCFDWLPGGTLGFIPAGERPEKRPLMSHAP